MKSKQDMNLKNDRISLNNKNHVRAYTTNELCSRLYEIINFNIFYDNSSS